MRRVINQKRLRTWEARGGICCFLAGVLAPLLGGLLTVIEWIVGTAVHPWIHVTSTALFIVAIPLILFAGFCLDWAEQGQKKSPHYSPTSTSGVPVPGSPRGVAAKRTYKFGQAEN